MQKHLQRAAVDRHLLWQHEVHGVRGHRKDLSVHTSLQVSAEQRAEPGNVDQLCRKRPVGQHLETLLDKTMSFFQIYSFSLNKKTKTLRISSFSAPHHAALWCREGYRGLPECLCVQFSLPGASTRESCSPDRQSCTATSPSSQTSCFLGKTVNTKPTVGLCLYVQIQMHVCNDKNCSNLILTWRNVNESFVSLKHSRTNRLWLPWNVGVSLWVVHINEALWRQFSVSPMTYDSLQQNFWTRSFQEVSIFCYLAALVKHPVCKINYF